MSPLFVLCLVASAAAQSHNACTSIPSGYCINMLTDSCPSDTYVSYSGCGFLEQCCYKSLTQPQSTSSNVNSMCGVTDYNSNYKIVGGSQTIIQKYPWQVSIQLNDYHICGGAIIGDRWILSAAHCFREEEEPVYTSQFTIVAGSTDHEYISYNNRYTVDYIITHQNYVKLGANDIALLKVRESIDLSGSLKKAICLSDKGDDFTGQVCVATGWGRQKEGEHEPSSELLREVDLPVVDHTMCTYFDGWVDTNNICAGPRVGGKDTCQGDSGGPLACQTSQGIWKQAGIVSYGAGCAHYNQFGVYTDVSKFRDWIQDVMSMY